MSPPTLLLARWGFSLAFGLAGLYLVSAFIRLIFRQRDWKKRAVRAEGTIVGFEQVTASGEPAGHHLFAPIVTFPAPNGESIEFKSSQAVRPNPYTVGQKVAVRYLPENPDGADLESVASGWFSLIVIFVMAVVALTISTLPFILPPPAPR